MGCLPRWSKKVKIGVYLGHGLPSAHAGGGFTFQESLLNALMSYQGKHTFILYYYGDTDEKGSSSVYYKSLVKRVFSQFKTTILIRLLNSLSHRIDKYQVKKKYQSYLNKAVIEDPVDLVWFMTPTFEYVEIPYLLTVWDLQHRRQSFFPEVSVSGSTFAEREAFYQTVIPRSTYTIVGNQEAKKEVVRFYGMPDERVKTLEFPTPDFAFKVHEKLSVDIIEKYSLQKPFLFYPAQFWPHKNHVAIIEAVKKLKEDHNETFHVVFTGSDKGNLSYVKAFAKESGVSDQVHFLGFVSVEELVAFYKNAFALVFASYFGPNNIPPLEAMAFGCPVIAADVPGVQEQLGDAALFFAPQDVTNLVQRIISLAQQNDLRVTLIEAGKRRADSWKSCDYIKAVVSIIDEFDPIRRCWSSQQRYIHT